MSEARYTINVAVIRHLTLTVDPDAMIDAYPEQAEGLGEWEDDAEQVLTFNPADIELFVGEVLATVNLPAVAETAAFTLPGVVNVDPGGAAVTVLRGDLL